MVVCLERGADLHMVQLMPLTVSSFSKIQVAFTFLVPADSGSPGKRAIKCVCVCVLFYTLTVICNMLYLTPSRLAYYFLLTLTLYIYW